MYANQYLAYETLSEPLRRFLDGLTAVNISTKPVHSKTLEDSIRASRGNQNHAYVAEHPAVLLFLIEPDHRRRTSDARPMTLPFTSCFASSRESDTRLSSWQRVSSRRSLTALKI